MEERDQFTPYDVRVGTELFAFPGDSPPHAAAIGENREQIELVWRQGGALMHSQGTLAERNGTWNVAMTAPEEIAFPDRQKDQLAMDAYDYFLLTVAGLCILLWVVRAPVMARPFVPPSGLAPASLLARPLAAVTDAVPWLIVASLIMRLNPDDAFKVVVAQDPTEVNAKIIVASMLWLGLYVLYGAICEAAFGTTPGKKLFRMRVADDAGRKPDLRAALLRNLMKIVELTPIALPFATMRLPLLLAAPFLGRFHRRVGDVLARTIVVQDREIAPAPPPQPPPQE